MINFQINLPDSKVRISAFGVPPFSGIQTLLDISKKKVVGHQNAMLCVLHTICTVQNRYKIKTGISTSGQIPPAKTPPWAATPWADTPQADTPQADSLTRSLLNNLCIFPM